MKVQRNWKEKFFDTDLIEPIPEDPDPLERERREYEERFDCIYAKHEAYELGSRDVMNGDVDF